MRNFKEKDYRVFEMFGKDLALVTAGNKDKFNTCTIGWGSLGNIWGGVNGTRSVVTVYIHPSRYTSEIMNSSDTFTVSFYPEQYKKALGYMGSHSGKNEDKVKGSGLTPLFLENAVTYKEAKLTFVCHKLYAEQFKTENLDDEIKKYYADGKEHFSDGKGGWQPHFMYIGEIVGCLDSEEEI